MAVPTNTVQTYTQIGKREELADMIDMLDTDITPIYSTIKHTTATSTHPEWQRDELSASNGDNKTIQGDDVTAEASNQPVRLGTYTQLSDKVAQVSSTSQAVKLAGRGNDLLRDLLVKGRELKTDIEKRITGNYASVVGATGTPAETAGMEAWIETNTSLGATGAAGGFNSGTGIVDAGTDGTKRAVSETMLKNVVKSIADNGGSPSMVLVGSFNKQKISDFSGIATQYRENSGVKQATILGAADVYVSDFGELKVVWSRHTRDRTALVLDPKKWELAFLRKMKREKLAKTGHSDKEMISAEYALKSLNEKASGKIADLNDS